MDVCPKLEAFADSARDGQLHQAELRLDKNRRVSCKRTSAADAGFCRWLLHYWKRFPYYNGLSRKTLTCIGQDPDPPEDPGADAISIDPMWIHGTWTWESETLAHLHVRFEFTFDVREEANPRIWRFVARPE